MNALTLTVLIAAQAIRPGGGVTPGTVAAAGACMEASANGDCTMTQGTTYSGVTTDITSAGSEDVTITAGGTGDVVLGSQVLIRHAQTPQLHVGTVGNAYLTVDTNAAAGAPNVAIGVGKFGGTGSLDQKFMWAPRAKSISTADTATAPAHHLITISSTGAAAWTPPDSGSVSGECFRAVNTGTDTITMTDSAGVYEGTCVMSQYEAVEACYVGDRWVQWSCSDELDAPASFDALIANPLAWLRSWGWALLVGFAALGFLRARLTEIIWRRRYLAGAGIGALWLTACPAVEVTPTEAAPISAEEPTDEPAPIGPYAITSRIMRIDLHDADGVGAIDVDAHYRLTTDSAEAIAMGAQHRGVVVRMECAPRGTCLTAIGTLLNNSLIVQDGGWPEGAVPLPRPRKP